MGKYIFQKIKNQKWLSGSLVLGMALFIAIICCQPIFQNACQNKLIQKMFVNYIRENNQYPVVIGKKGQFENGVMHSVAETRSYLEGYRNIWMSTLPRWDEVASQEKYSIYNEHGTGNFAGISQTMEIIYVPQFQEHMEVVEGASLNAAKVLDNYDAEVFPCMASEYTMDYNQLALGEKVIFKNLVDENEKPIVFQIVGVFKEKDSRDLFWYHAANAGNNDLYVSEEAFDYCLQHTNYWEYHYDYDYLMDYEKIKDGTIRKFLDCMYSYDSSDSSFFYTFKDIAVEYEMKQKQISVMLWVLELPMIGMVFAFLYMVSNRIVSTSKNELATLMSRGFMNRHILLMYLAEYGVLGLLALVFGLPMGYGFCCLCIGTTDFMVFSGRGISNCHFVLVALLYGIIAMLLAILFVLIPVFFHCGKSIVEVKAHKHLRKKMFWEKSFLDFILLGVSLYFVYNFNITLDRIRDKALAGNKIDPFIFLNVCLFMIACGFVMFRLMHYFVLIVYKIGKNHWKPVAYASFLQITRSFRGQTFISVFIILTIAFGLFDANVARTINRNSEDRVIYKEANAIRFMERWNVRSIPGTMRFFYVEPDYIKYQNLISNGLCDQVTRVFKYADIKAEGHRNTANNVQFIGIETKPFGETTYLKPELYGDRHWYHSLNTLATEKMGVIISDNMAEELSLEIGDYVRIFNEKAPGAVENMMALKVVEIVSAWPGFQKYEYVNGEEKENFLAVTNFVTLNQGFTLAPYEIWCKPSKGVTDQQVFEYLTKDQGIPLVKFNGVDFAMEELKESPEIQTVNGMFTISFLIALVLCGVGFLIYWLISIKERELLLGSYRAMGLSVRSVNRMLIYEHIFSTFLSVLGGVGTGMLATALFIRIFSVVYLPEKSVLGIYTYYEVNDALKLLAAITVMIVLCLGILRRQIKKMNITQALKLGED